jgi:branched-chain amino acid aminotransferase
MTEPIAFVDGALVPRAQASVSVDDAAVRYGAACFETMRATNGRVFRLLAHLERLHAGLEGMGVEAPPAADLERAVSSALEANRLSEARIRLSVSAGRMPGPDLAATAGPSVVVLVDPVGGGAPLPLALAVASVRVDAGRPLAFAKTVQYLSYLLARAEARAIGADDALLLNTTGSVCETSAANLFVVRDGQLMTPALSSGPLPGVTRSVLLDLAASLGPAAVEQAVTLDELTAADELFVTNSVVGTQPVRSVAHGGSVLWQGTAPGPVTARLADEYARLVSRESGGGSDG